VIFAAFFAGLAVLGLLIMILNEDRMLREVRGRPAAADRHLLRVFVLVVVLALIAFYAWFMINPAPGALL
jgi:hypothetical protein